MNYIAAAAILSVACIVGGVAVEEGCGAAESNLPPVPRATPDAGVDCGIVTTPSAECGIVTTPE